VELSRVLGDSFWKWWEASSRSKYKGGLKGTGLVDLTSIKVTLKNVPLGTKSRLAAVSDFQPGGRALV
jgi:hypothetical protein